MRAVGLLSELRALDVHVELDGDRLRLRAPKGALSDDHRRQLRECKAEIVKFLHEARQLAGQQRAVVPLKATGTRAPIFGIGGHNGDVFCYRSLVQHLDAEQPFYGLQPPGLEEGSEPCTTVEGLAGYFAEQLKAFRPQGPVALAGYCAGGTIAFDLARQISESGREVRRIILFGAAYCARYHSVPRLAFAFRSDLRSIMHHTRALISLPPTEWRHYLAERTLMARRHRAPRYNPISVRRRAVEKATLAAIAHYTPQTFDVHVDIMLPCAYWKRSWAAPLLWLRHAATGDQYVGPDDCVGDTMLLPEHAATFASFVNEVQDSGQENGRQ